VKSDDSKGVIQFHDVKGPEWIFTDPGYDVAAKIPAGATKAEVRLMLRNLLVDRFHLSVRYETRMLPSYALAVGKGSPKLKASASSSPTADGAAAKEPPWPFEIKVEGNHWHMTAARQGTKRFAF
jgi:uncharacterized protein (TIGR03435 family)